MAREWIVELQEGCWISKFGGRTVLKENARRYTTPGGAASGLLRLYEKNKWPEIRIHVDDEMHSRRATTPEGGGR